KVEVIPAGTIPRLNGPVGYIQLTSFNEKTSAQMGAALRQLNAQGVEGIILDLRDNPGGVFEASLEVANRFLDGGPIVHIVGRGDQRRTLWATAGADFPDKPVVVLVNEFSASSSEIVAGALRDRGRAILVGTTTFGKGLVQ